MTNFEIPVSQKIQFIAEELIKIGGDYYACVLEDYQNEFNETLRIVDNEDCYSLFSNLDKHEILINHDNQTIEINLFDYGYSTYEIDGRFLLIEFDLKKFYKQKIDGKDLVSQIEKAYLDGLLKYESLFSEQKQLNMFENQGITAMIKTIKELLEENFDFFEEGF